MNAARGAGARRVRTVAWFEVAVGASVAALWTGLLATAGVPEVEEGRTDIWFHIAAETAMALALLVGGVTVLRGLRAGPFVSTLALGALGYSAVNSAGHYAASGDWVIVAAFGLVAAATATGLMLLWRGARVPVSATADVTSRRVGAPAGRQRPG